MFQWMKSIAKILDLPAKKRLPENESWFVNQLMKEDPHAIYQVGVMMLNGNGFAKDQTQAYQFIRKSANLNYAPAQFRLWSDYGFGRGLPKNKILSYVWCQLSVNNGNHQAIEIAKEAREKLSDAEREKADELLALNPERIPSVVELQ